MIRLRTLLACLTLLIVSGAASAQTTFYGTLSCDETAAPRSAVAKITPAGKNAAAAKKNRVAQGDASAKTIRGASQGEVGNSTPASSVSGPASSVAQEDCSWTFPLQIGNDTAHEGQTTINSTVTGSQSKDTGSHTSQMTNSDQFTMSLSGTTVLDGAGAPRSRQGTWKFTGGTGRLKGITGSGTYSGLAKAAGGMSYDIEGNYEFPASPVASPAPEAPGVANPGSPAPGSAAPFSPPKTVTPS